MKDALRKAVRVVALLNLAYFGVEFSVALLIGSVALFEDSIDFLEDASINVLILLALAWSAPRRGQQGTCWYYPDSRSRHSLDGLAEVPRLDAACATSALATGAGALLVNFVCALILVRVRHHGGSLGLAAFLSARNDVFANAAIILAGLVTGYTLSVLPDLLVGLGIAILNAGAAAEVYRAAGKESDAKI
jgi:Co/Zn/Cd efflux system component